MKFNGRSVEIEIRTIKRGRYFVSNDQVHIILDNSSETVATLVPNISELTFNAAAAPCLRSHGPIGSIQGEWHCPNSVLTFKSHGLLEETTVHTRSGSFETTPHGLKIHWLQPDGPGGSEWNLQIKRHHLEALIGNRKVPYHYIPPGPDWTI